MYKIESFLSARLFLYPQLVNGRIYFISNLSGHLSLFVMDDAGSVPEPLLPPEIAVQNPHLVGGQAYFVFPGLNKIIIMLDKDGNEDYKPMEIPLAGGYPKPAFGDMFDHYKVFLGHCEPKKNICFLSASAHNEPNIISFLADVANNNLTKIFEGPYGAYPDGKTSSYDQLILVEGYSVGDNVLYHWTAKTEKATPLFGTPLHQRGASDPIKTNGIGAIHFVDEDKKLIFATTLFTDTGGIGQFSLSEPNNISPIEITGIVHKGVGEFNGLEHLEGDKYLAYFNIDGCDWVYEGTYMGSSFHLNKVIVGTNQLSDGVLEHLHYDKSSNQFVISHSTAVSPTQIYKINRGTQKVTRITNERLLGIPNDLLSPGEDASYVSFDGERVSSRLYFPNESLGFAGPRPLVYYIHGGPQSQERPDFAWFSMPLIQFLTLNGFAVFVPNVRGSTGYGMAFTKKVDKDWGGDDRLDHVFAMTDFLPKDSRLDMSRAAVVGRSYGGYMTLTLATRHPNLWKASCDMFGPYDLLTFLDRIPETWKPYFKIALGDPDIPSEREFLIGRSPRTHIEGISSPMLVIQGANDPRVVEQESRDLVEYLRSIGKQVEYLMFNNEGHDVLKFENRVTCYNSITDFFTKTLNP